MSLERTPRLPVRWDHGVDAGYAGQPVDLTEDGVPIVVADFIAEFVPQPESTGRFAGASGSWVMYAWTEPFVLGSNDFVYYSWEGEETLTFTQP